MTEPYKSLESRIRETMRQHIVDKVKLTTKVIEQPKPQLVIVEEVESVEEISKEKIGQYVKRAAGEMETEAGHRSNMSAAQHKVSDKGPYIKSYVNSYKKSVRRVKGIDLAVKKLTKEEEAIDELAPTAQNPMKAKMDAQRQQVQKQKDQLRMQLAQQKAAKQLQAEKNKGEKSLEKIKEQELDERQVVRVRTFGRASKLQQLHNRQYSRLSAAGNTAKAQLHRKRSEEYKRIMYMAKDNPDKLPSI